MGLKQDYTKQLFSSISGEERTEAKLSKIPYQVSDLLLKDVKGRPQPIRPTSIVPSREAKRMLLPSVPLQTYPKKLKNDSQKFAYLKSLFLRNTIEQEIFVDLASVLQLKKGLIDAVICPFEV